MAETLQFVPEEVRDPRMRAYLRDICDRLKADGEWMAHVQVGVSSLIYRKSSGGHVATVEPDAPAAVTEHIVMSDPIWVSAMLDYIDELEQQVQSKGSGDHE